MDPQDAETIESIPVNRTQMEDRDECHFTNNEKFTVKSGYQVERVYLDKKKPPIVFGPTVDLLKAFCWKVWCPPKIKHFYDNWCQGVYRSRKICKREGYKRIYVVPDVELWRN